LQQQATHEQSGAESGFDIIASGMLLVNQYLLPDRHVFGPRSGFFY